MGEDISRGPLSDGVRETARRIIAERTADILLEVGVGEGLLADALIVNRTARRIVGIDFSKPQLAAAVKRIVAAGAEGGCCLLPVMAVGDALPFKEEVFDLAVSVNTLHNQPSWDEASALLGELCGTVRPGGRVVFDIRNGGDPLISTAYLFSTVIDPTTKRLPVNAYSIHRVTRRLSELGFKITKRAPVKYRFWPIPSAYVIEAVKVAK